MKTYIVAAAMAAVLGGGVFLYVTKNKAASETTQQATAKAERGEIQATVASNGRVASNLDVEIKCKASGEIVELPVDISDTVKKGDLLVKLDPVDEDRNLRKAQVSLEASQARLVSAQQSLEIAKQTLVTDQARAQSALESAQAKAKDARSKADRTKELYEKKISSLEEWETAETTAVQAAGDLKNAQVKLQELKTQSDALELKRQDVKLAQSDVESDDIALKVCEDRVADTTVNAPMDGVISARTVQIGQIISSGITTVGGGTSIMTLSDLSRIFVYASVDESDIGRVQLGQPVTITADGLPDMIFNGTVSRIATQGTNVSNVVTFEVQIEVLSEQRADRSSRQGSGGSSGRRGRPRGNAPGDVPSRGASSAPASRMADAASGPAHSGFSGRRDKTSTQAASSTSGPQGQHKILLKPQMTANVVIIVAQRPDAITVPVEAIVRKGGQPFVTLVKDGGANVEVPVTTGITDGTRIEIVSGLDEGQTVLLHSGAADSKWNGQRGGNPMRGMIPGGRH